MHLHRFFSAILLIIGLTSSLIAADTLKSSTSPRNGVSNCAHVFTSTGKGRVAFLGGSITEMEGYRPRTYETLKTQFPQTQFEFINAGIGSTGSTTGAFRLRADILSEGKIDLLFVEFAVNDDQDSDRADTQMVRAMEGIVLQARADNPATDIIFLYTDGISEVFDSDDKELDLDQLTDVIRRNHDKSASEILDAVYQAVTRFAAPHHVYDDLTMIVVKRLP
jgi:lysophospholipase L1-like esterase